jgi:hypothetical protein
VEENSKSNTLVYLIGGLAGLLTGLAAAFLFIRSHNQLENKPKLTSKQGMKLGMGIVSFLKQIIELQ